MLITSTQNARVREVLRLTEKAAERRRQGLFVLEGPREFQRAIRHGLEPEAVFHCQDILGMQEWETIAPSSGNYGYFHVSRHVFSRMAYRDDSGGLVAVMRQRSHPLGELTLTGHPLLLVLESVEKPGNLGAILRTADAAGLDAVIVCDPQTDLYNPNVVRSSTGALFSVPIGVAPSGEVIRWLSDRGIRTFCTYLGASVPYHEADLRGPAAIVMGTEAVGLSQEWVGSSFQNIIIPMHGTADSLNVSTTAAIVVFEALRQRGS